MSVLILSCSTGQGHNSCAGAIKEYFEARGVETEIRDVLRLFSKSAANFVSWGHTTMYRHFHGLFQFGYSHSEKHNTFARTSPTGRLLARGAEKVYSYIREHHFDCVICTHIFGSLMMTEVRRRWHLSIPVCLVETDYTCTPGTKETRLDRYFIAARPISVHYECSEIGDERMIPCGIPVRQMFYRNTPKDEAMAAFGIPAGHQHLLMMCGSMGCGPMKKLAKRLVKVLPEKTDLSIVCGTNKSLQKSLQKTYAGTPAVHVLGYVKDVSKLMDSADLYLTKPGGIGVTEAAIKDLPMVLIDAVGGCEAYNKIFFIQQGAAVTGTSLDELTGACVRLLTDHERLRKMHEKMKSAKKLNAAEVIYNEMKALAEKTGEPAAEQ